MTKVEIGLTSFGDNQDIYTENGHTPAISNDERIRNIVEEIKLADEVGLDVYGLGEHHRPDYAVSDPGTVLAAAAVVTDHIKLSSAVTVLLSDDPVRVYQQFATIDGLSNGRAEIMAGRGSFIESFPLFGYDLNHYQQLFDEKLELLMMINKQAVIHWDGQLRPSIDGRGVYPRAVQKELPIWLATGGTPESSLKAGRLGLPITYAIIGGNPRRFARNVAMYRAAAESAGFDANQLQVATHSWGYIAETDEQAQREFYRPTEQHHNVLAKERGWPPFTMEHYQREVGPEGAMYVGSPETVAQKIIDTVEALGITRFMLHLPIGSMPHERTMNAIRLLGEEVKPMVDQYFLDKEGEK
ncbi:LLM class flavin-dependent oxidoreductase [Staphylococcus sp. IVB6246]|uniref:LLM class flavin-dependent oxidoreductase n=1 Tax=Staphylococcus sp. IVB6246 TaxID=2989772 RepID=UPI0021D14686|nr:LLM class flavin-dependent oxidoreductase [Staphylococcus sp. IVB6246]UXR69309.1 LLM class flavin-dependent oxidoreductase [Staphylococcus sp. IVB6246]